jgi:tetratricopeptide (TPR) repeat protein
VVAIDWTQRWAWVVLELFKRGMFFLALLAGLGVVSMRSLADQRLDDRPAPWIFWSILVAVGLFLIHNLIDFSLFEPGPLALFALLAGGALGMRLPPTQRAKGGTAVAITVFVMCGVAWLVGAAAGAWNVALAESFCQEAEQQVRANNPTTALQKLIDASRLIPINPEYPFHAALLSPKNTLMVREMLVKAILADPASAHYRRVLAQFELTDKDPAHALTDYELAVELDPNNMNQRIEYAEALTQNGQTGKARVQYQKTLELNEVLPVSEPQRLPDGELAAIRARLAGSSS